MSTPHHDTLQPEVSLETTPTPFTRLPPPSRDFKDSKKVCFYRSGDAQFTGQWVVINSRTFKTFDALLDVLSKKVPLPFGVRTVTTPKGTHTVQSLGDLQNGASYVCSDQKRVKPLILNEVNRSHVPWNTTRPTSAGRHKRRGLIRQLVKHNEVSRRARNAVAVWIPRRLVVFKNRDPSIKRIVILQRSFAPTFEALLDYLSQVMQFPVVKLYSANGRRVDDLPALVMCSGTVVAAGNEPFRLGYFNLQGATKSPRSVTSEFSGPAKTQSMPKVKKMSVSCRTNSRNFSLSSERYFVSQINKSLNGSHSQDSGQKMESLNSMNHQTVEENDRDNFIVRTDDEIEKSLRVNQDGSMTVEMKVRLTIKSEEMINWTTTVSRACVDSQQMALCSKPVSAYNSPNNNKKGNQTTTAKRACYRSEEENTLTDKSISLNEDENHYGSDTFEALEKPKSCFRRLPTPGPNCVRRKGRSVKNIKGLSPTEIQEKKSGTYSYTDCKAERELMEGYCVVSHSSSSSTRPVPKLRTNSLRTETKHKKVHTSRSGMSEVLQLQNNGIGTTESVMHIYQSQDTVKNYITNSQGASDSKSQKHKKPDSTVSEPCSLSNECDTDRDKQSACFDFQNPSKNELLSLSSTQSSTPQKISNNAASERQAMLALLDRGFGNLQPPYKEKSHKKIMYGKQVSSAPELKICSSPKLEKKTFSSVESAKHAPRVKMKRKVHSKQKENSDGMRASSQNGNVRNTNLQRCYFKKKTDIMAPSPHLPSLKMLTKQRSFNGRSHKECRELIERVSMPPLHSPFSVHQYVENLLKKIQHEPATYMDGINLYDTGSEARAKFQIGSGSTDTYEMRSEVEKESVQAEEFASTESGIFKKAAFQPPVQIRYKGKPMETQKMRRLCKSWPCVRAVPADALVPREQDDEASHRSGMKYVSEQLCLSIQSIRQASSEPYLPSLEERKQSILRELSTQFAPVFGLTIRDEVFKNSHEDSHIYPEALGVMQPREKIASIVDEEELKASLSSLHSSISSKLKKSCRALREKNDIEECPSLSPSLSKQEFALVVNSVGEDQEKEQTCGIKELMDKFNKNEDLCKEVSFLVGENLSNSGEKYANQTANIAFEDKDAPVKDDEGFSEAKQHFLGKNDSQSVEIANTDEAGFKETEELNILESSHESALGSHALIMRESDSVQNVQTEVEAGHKELVRHMKLVEDKVQTNQYRVNETHQPYLDKEKESIINNVQKCSGCKTTQVHEIHYSQTNLLEKNQEQYCMLSESDVYSYTIETETRNLKSCSVVSDKTAIKSGHNTDGLEEHDINADECIYKTSKHAEKTNIAASSDSGDVPAHHLSSTLKAEHDTKIGSDTDSLQEYDMTGEENNYHKTRTHAEQTMGSETEDVEAHHPPSIAIHDTFDKDENKEDAECQNNALTLKEENIDIEDNSRSGASDDSDPHNSNSPVEQRCNDKVTLFNTESDAGHHYSLLLDQADKHTDQHKSAPCEPQESEAVSEEGVTQKTSDDCQYSDNQDGFDFQTEYPRQSDQEVKYSNHSEFKSCKWQDKQQTLTVTRHEMVKEEQINSSEEKDVDKERSTQGSTKHLDALWLHYNYIADSTMRKRDSEKHKTLSEHTEAQEDGAMDHDKCLHPMEISQHMLDFINLALRSCAFTFRYDSKDQLRIEPDRCKVIEKAESYVDNQYRQKCLPSPNTSDLSDYRPDTSNSSDVPQVSTDLLTESEEEEERLYTFQGNMESSIKPHPLRATIQTASYSLESISSLSSFPESMASYTEQGLGPSNENPVPAQCRSSHAKVDSSEGILIDKGRWLLKENHLIRKSPPVPVGMYENADTTSVDTGQDNTSEEPPYSNSGGQQSPLAVISSSELEDMAKPFIPKCAYFNMSHASDSDPFLDNESINSNKRRGDTRKSKDLKVSPMGETLKKGVKQNGSLSSFALVEFKLATGKVHPENGLVASDVEKSTTCQSVNSKAPHDEEPVEALDLRCGQHCPIL